LHLYRPPVRLLLGHLGPAEDQALEMAVAHALVRRASGGRSAAVLRIYRPSAPTVAFGRRDTLAPGFGAAVRATRAAGFVPVVREPGGRAVAYTVDSLVADHVSPTTAFPAGMDQRFTSYGQLWAGLLREHGVDARLGAVPGEYCPGAASVNARGRVKLVGTAQRVLRRAWLFSAVAIVDGATVLRPLLDEIYRHLGQPFDPASVGSISLEAPRLSIGTLEAAVVAAYEQRFDLQPANIDPEVMAGAHDLSPDHRL